MNNRLIKILFIFAVILYMTLVCFKNIFDYSSNFQFFRMVATMEDTFSKQRNSWRSITSVSFHHLLFVFIILWELTIALLLVSGGIAMSRKINRTMMHLKRLKHLPHSAMLWVFCIGLSYLLLWEVSGF